MRILLFICKGCTSCTSVVYTTRKSKTLMPVIWCIHVYFLRVMSVCLLFCNETYMYPQERYIYAA